MYQQSEKARARPPVRAEPCNRCNAHLPRFQEREVTRTALTHKLTYRGSARAQKLGKAPQKLRFRAAQDTRSGNQRDAGIHRHPARVSATLLPKDSSLFDAMRAIIGSELRSKLEVPKAMPSYLDALLKELDDRLGSDST
jgi:hypothetical protein